MRASFVRRRRRLSGAALLLLLLLRAYVPMGFMPSAGFLALEICPEGLPQQAHHLHHHGGDQAHDAFEHCPFGSAPATGPATYLASLPRVRAWAPEAAAQRAEAPLVSRSERAHPATGPPFLS